MLLRIWSAIEQTHGARVRIPTIVTAHTDERGESGSDPDRFAGQQQSLAVFADAHTLEMHGI